MSDKRITAWRAAGKTAARVVLGAALLVALLAAIAWMAGAFEPKIEPVATERAPRSLTADDQQNLDQVHEVVKEYFEDTIGTLKAANRTVISARILAPIDKIHVGAGQMVKEGDALVELDRRALDTQESQARSALVAAQAALANAEADYRRDYPLYRKRVISQADMDRSTTALRVARAKVQEANQEVSRSAIMRSYTTITAPKAGMIVQRLAEPGDMAQPGVTLLELYDPTTLRLEVPVMENLAMKLRVGQMLSVHIDALDRDVEATVDEIVPQAEQASRSLLVKVKLPRSEGLFEGMAGRLQIPAGQRRHLCLATAAIDRVGQLEFVDVVDPEHRTKQRRFIKSGRIGMPGRIEVLSGLSAGERVLLKRQPVEETGTGPVEPLDNSRGRESSEVPVPVSSPTTEATAPARGQP